jgi:hypothetical protein
MREILIKSVFVDTESIKVTPVQCPGQDRDDVLKDSEGMAVCILDKRICKYLENINFNASDHKETLFCNLPEESE